MAWHRIYLGGSESRNGSLRLVINSPKVQLACQIGADSMMFGIDGGVAAAVDPTAWGGHHEHA
jgi:hypothetical protein